MKNNYKFAAIILAAGFSKRMAPRIKALLPVGEKTAIKSLIDCFKKAEVEDIVVVLGHHQAKIEAEIKNADVKIVYNKNYPNGMFSSISAGVMEVKKLDCHAFFLLPVDYMLIDKEIIIIMKQSFAGDRNEVIYPMFKGERGHPPLIGCQLIDEIITYNGEGGLRKLLENPQIPYREIPFNTDSIILDVDTPEDYRRIVLKNINLKG